MGPCTSRAEGAVAKQWYAFFWRWETHDHWGSVCNQLAEKSRLLEPLAEELDWLESKFILYGPPPPPPTPEETAYVQACIEDADQIDAERKADARADAEHSVFTSLTRGRHRAMMLADGW